MNPSHHISGAEARKIILNAQGLNRVNPFGSGINSVIKAVEHLGYVQLDTISVVHRAHHHILWSRIPNYKTDWLTLAQTKHHKVFEYWSHAAAYLPMRDYRYSLPVMEVFRKKKDRWPKINQSDMKKVMDRIREEGPLMSRDFESTHKGGTWWDWKPAKWALQRLFLEGTLMVSHREGFQRVYDLAERIIPAGTDTSSPTIEEYYSHLIKRTLEAQGLATRNEIFHLRDITYPLFDATLKNMEEAGEITGVQIEGSKKYYTLPEYMDTRIRVKHQIRFLSPFDNTIIWRSRLKDVFNFDYTLECYIPAPKRVYGYFCLPILYQDQFIGRIDMKADRKNSTLLVQKLFWDEGWKEMELNPLFEEALNDYAIFNQCEYVEFKN